MGYRKFMSALKLCANCIHIFTITYMNQERLSDLGSSKEGKFFTNPSSIPWYSAVGVGDFLYAQVNKHAEINSRT